MIGQMPNWCLMCGGTGRLKRMAKAKQLNGPDIVMDYDTVECPSCKGTGGIRLDSTSLGRSAITAPCRRYTV